MVSIIRLPKQSGVIIPIGMCRFRLRLPYAVINTVPVKVDGKDFHSRLNPVNLRPYFIAIRKRRIFLQSIRIPLFCFRTFSKVSEHNRIKQSHTVVLQRQLLPSPHDTFYSIKQYFLLHTVPFFLGLYNKNSSFVYYKIAPVIYRRRFSLASK